MNFQKTLSPNGTFTYEYVRIGGWDNGNLTMEDNIFWPNKKAIPGGEMIESVCSKPCPRGQIKVYKPLYVGINFNILCTGLYTVYDIGFGSDTSLYNMYKIYKR